MGKEELPDEARELMEVVDAGISVHYYELYKFAKRFTNMTDRIIFEDQYGYDPIDDFENILESAKNNGS